MLTRNDSAYARGKQEVVRARDPNFETLVYTVRGGPTSSLSVHLADLPKFCDGAPSSPKYSRLRTNKTINAANCRRKCEFRRRLTLNQLVHLLCKRKKRLREVKRFRSTVHGDTPLIGMEERGSAVLILFCWHPFTE